MINTQNLLDFSLFFIRGRIKLRSENPDEHPLIIPNFFDDEEDLIPFVEAFKFGKKLAAALDKYNATFFNQKDPACSEFLFGKFKY